MPPSSLSIDETLIYNYKFISIPTHAHTLDYRKLNWTDGHLEQLAVARLTVMNLFHEG